MFRLFAVFWLTPLYLFLGWLDSVTHRKQPKLQLVHTKKLPAVHRSSS
ncbi:MAG: hypothetical protein ACLQF1_17010 [Methyloceanibacter sp.]|jgi:hypothetical protein